MGNDAFDSSLNASDQARGDNLPPRVEDLIPLVEQALRRLDGMEDIQAGLDAQVQRNGAGLQQAEAALREMDTAAAILARARDQAAMASGDWPPSGGGGRCKRPRPAWFKGVISGGAAAFAPVLGSRALWWKAVAMAGGAAVAGGAVVAPSLVTGAHPPAAWAAVHPKPAIVMPAAGPVPGEPPVIVPASVADPGQRRCHDRDGDNDVVAVLLSDQRRVCRDRDAAADARTRAHKPGKGAHPSPSPSPSVTVPVPSPGPSCVLAGKSHHCRGNEGEDRGLLPGVPASPVRL